MRLGMQMPAIFATRLASLYGNASPHYLAQMRCMANITYS